MNAYIIDAVRTPIGKFNGTLGSVRPDDLAAIPRVGIGAEAEGDISYFPDGIAIGSGIARELGVGLWQGQVQHGVVDQCGDERLARALGQALRQAVRSGPPWRRCPRSR